MPKAIQTTATFDTEDKAKLLRKWLILNTADCDFGFSRFINMRGSKDQWTVEYITEKPELINGIVIGINL